MWYLISKRICDVSLSLLLLLILLPVILVLILISAIDTQSNGLFSQIRVGQYGKLFNIYKVRSYNKNSHKISRFGRFIRKRKLDELPQLVNVLIGEMSFVGPRPDIPGYYDLLEGKERLILDMKPGITCEASIKYNHEEEILALHEDALQYNDNVIFPDKIKMNLKYYYERNLFRDFKILWNTVF